MFYYICTVQLKNKEIMKIVKYVVNQDQDFQFITLSEIEKRFPNIHENVHQPCEGTFFLVAEDDVHFQVAQIFTNPEFADFYEGSPVEITDVTFDVLNNIEKYENLPNQVSDNNVLLNTYFQTVDKDFILDKILEFGIESINNIDKQVLAA